MYNSLQLHFTLRSLGVGGLRLPPLLDYASERKQAFLFTSVRSLRATNYQLSQLMSVPVASGYFLVLLASCRPAGGDPKGPKGQGMPPR